MKSTLLGVTVSLLTGGSLLAQSTDATGGSGGLIFLLVIGVFAIVAIPAIVGLWKVFVKAGHPGWTSIVPIYNVFTLCNIVGKPGWCVILFCIPPVTFIILILIMLGLAKSFGKGAGFAIGLLLFGFVFFPILGFSDAAYKGPSA